MSNRVKLMSRMPGDEADNGLDDDYQRLIDDPGKVRVAVVWYDVAKKVESTDDGATVPYVRVRRWEPLGTIGEATDAVKEVALAAAEKRTGKTALPFDRVNPVSSEALDGGGIIGDDDGWGNAD